MVTRSRHIIQLVRNDDTEYYITHTKQAVSLSKGLHSHSCINGDPSSFGKQRGYPDGIS